MVEYTIPHKVQYSDQLYRTLELLEMQLQIELTLFYDVWLMPKIATVTAYYSARNIVQNWRTSADEIWLLK